MGIKDIIRNSAAETMMNNTLSTATIYTALGAGILFSLYIYGLYYFSQKRNFYNKQFNIVLGVLPIITAGIILAMQSNLVISLGMVGALSIVRFRTAVKEPKDLLFLFWSISIGIILGARNYGLAFAVCLVVTIMMTLFDLLPMGRSSALLVVNVGKDGKEADIMPIIAKYVKYPKVKSRSRTMCGLDLIVECRTKKEGELLEEISAAAHVLSASVVSHDGETVYS